MPLIWIHRTKSADLFVPVSNLGDALNYTKELLVAISPDNHDLIDVDIEELNFTGHSDVGVSPNLQIAYIFNTYVPNENWDYWNPDGYIMSNKKEAIELGIDGIPEGFIPGESSIPWTKETRSHSELDDELDNYMNKDSTSPIITRLKAMFGF